MQLPASPFSLLTSSSVSSSPPQQSVTLPTPYHHTLQIFLSRKLSKVLHLEVLGFFASRTIPLITNLPDFSMGDTQSYYEFRSTVSMVKRGFLNLFSTPDFVSSLWVIPIRSNLIPYPSPFQCPFFCLTFLCFLFGGPPTGTQGTTLSLLLWITFSRDKKTMQFSS